MVVALPLWRVVAAVLLRRRRRAVFPVPVAARVVVWHVALAVVVALALRRRIPAVHVATPRRRPPWTRIEFAETRARVERALARRWRAAIVVPVCPMVEARLAAVATVVVAAAAASGPLVTIRTAAAAATAKAATAVCPIIIGTLWRRVAPGR